MKAITYDPETHVLVPREPNYFELQETAEVYGLHFNKFCAAYKEAVLRVAAAAPQPEPVESEPIAWCLAYDDPNLKLRIHSNPTMCEAEIDAHVNRLNGVLSKAPLYTAPQPGRVAELEAEVLRLRNLLMPASCWIDEDQLNGGRQLYLACSRVLSTPFTPTALPELIENVEKRTIERCALEANKSWFKDTCYIYTITNDIRALPTGQIKLEELLK